MATIASKELSQRLNTLRELIEEQVKAYVENLDACLEQHIKMLEDDYSYEDSKDIVISKSSLRSHFQTGRHAFKDTLNAFFDGEIEGSTIDSTHELMEHFDSVESTMFNHLKDEDSETHTDVYTSLQDAAEKCLRSNAQCYQDDILKILRDEFNLNLIVAPNL